MFDTPSIPKDHPKGQNRLLSRILISVGKLFINIGEWLDRKTDQTSNYLASNINLEY